MNIEEIGFYKVADFILREPPARDECFKVVSRDADAHEYGNFSEVARREMIYRHMANEMTSVDMAAVCVAEFPDAPWGLRMELARQAWDEFRHVRVLYRRVKEMGGFKGEFPVSTLEWDMTCAVDNLVGRITIQNRTLEAGAMDVIGALALNFRSIGDDRTADMLDGINVDEIQHVRFANRWIKKLAETNPRVLMQMAAAIRFLTDANAKFQIKDGGEVNAVGAMLASPENRIPAVNVDLRQAAEFSEGEIHEILRQAGFRSLVPQGEVGMTSLEPAAPLDPKLFGPNPVRDERFDSKDRWHELPNFPHDHPNSSLEFLTRQMNEELNATEMAARNLVDFPDADWGLRMAIARQAADEARHAAAFRRLLEQRGGHLGQFPVINFQFRIMMMIPSLIGRLAVANCSFEAAGIDAIQDGFESSKRKEDLEFTALFDQQLADEMQHVRFANVWIKKIVDRDGARAMMALARAIGHANAAMKEIVGDDVVFYPVSEELRREAGFSEDEIQSARELADQK